MKKIDGQKYLLKQGILSKACPTSVGGYCSKDRAEEKTYLQKYMRICVPTIDRLDDYLDVAYGGASVIYGFVRRLQIIGRQRNDESILGKAVCRRRTECFARLR